LVELIGLAKKGVIKPIVSKRYSIDEATNALQDLKDRKVVGRGIIVP